MCETFKTEKRVPLWGHTRATWDTTEQKGQKALEDEQKKKIVQKEHAFKQVKEITLDKHFKNNKNLPARNSAIIEALKDGYTQGEIARYLNVSSALVSYIFRSWDD